MNELSRHTPELINEAAFGMSEVIPIDQKELIRQLRSRCSARDDDREAWIGALRLSIVGAKANQVFSTVPALIAKIQEQIEGGGYKDWMTAWNTIRWVPGQAKRMAQELELYKDEYRRNGEFAWVPTIIGLIIMIVRLDHPEYQKQ